MRAALSPFLQVFLSPSPLHLLSLLLLVVFFAPILYLFTTN